MKFQSNSIDAQHERDFASRFSAEFGDALSLMKLNDYQRLDWMAVNPSGRGQFFVEFKYRNYSKERFPTVFININKWFAIDQFSQVAKRPCLFACSFSGGDDMVYTYRSGDNFDIGYCDQSQEAVILIPIKKFVPLSSIATAYFEVVNRRVAGTN